MAAIPTGAQTARPMMPHTSAPTAFPSVGAEEEPSAYDMSGQEAGADGADAAFC
jgi:hypothetical protein